VGGVVASQVGQGVEIGEFVDRHDSKRSFALVGRLVGVESTEDTLADAAITVDGDVESLQRRGLKGEVSKYLSQGVDLKRLIITELSKI